MFESSSQEASKHLSEPVWVAIVVLAGFYRRDRKPLSVASCWSDFPPRELLLGLGVVEYLGGYLMKRRSSSFLIHRRSLVMAVMAQALVTRGLKQEYSSNLLVTCSRGGGGGVKDGTQVV